MRYKIRLSYDGSAFCGWQIQNNATTVQGELQDALAKLCGQPVQVTGAGRTDTDVNSINYIAHFDLPETVEIETPHLTYKLNAILSQKIVVHEISTTDEEFHARFDATCREYKYFIHFFTRVKSSYFPDKLFIMTEMSIGSKPDHIITPFLS